MLEDSLRVYLWERHGQGHPVEARPAGRLTRSLLDTIHWCLPLPPGILPLPIDPRKALLAPLPLGLISKPTSRQGAYRIGRRGGVLVRWQDRRFGRRKA